MAARIFPNLSKTKVQRLFAGMDEGRAVRDICADPGMPDMETLKAWRKRYREFAAEYEAAVERKRLRKSIS